MGLDIRWPIGLMFVVLGFVLSTYGLASDPVIYTRSFGINVNLIWGAVLLAFGLLMAGLGRRGQAAKKSE